MAGDAFDFVVVGVPRTPQSRSVKTWQQKVRDAAIDEWPKGQAPFKGELSARIVYFFPKQTGLDVDNFIKPILDSLEGLVYENDRVVFEIVCRKSPLSKLTLLTNAPPKLVQSLQADTDQVFIRIREGPRHEELPL